MLPVKTRFVFTEEDVVKVCSPIHVHVKKTDLPCAKKADSFCRGYLTGLSGNALQRSAAGMHSCLPWADCMTSCRGDLALSREILSVSIVANH